MEDKEIEIWVCCRSEKVDADISCGITISERDYQTELPEPAWIYEGLSDAYWENYFEFEPYTEKAEILLKNGEFVDYKEALFSILGHFSLSFEVDGEKKDLAYNIDVDELMYSIILEQTGWTDT